MLLLAVTTAALTSSWAAYSATGVLGAVLAWVSLRLNGALVWKTNAEGYKAELERATLQYKSVITGLEAKIALLESHIRDLEHKVLSMDTSAMAAKIAAELAALTVKTATDLEAARASREKNGG